MKTKTKIGLAIIVAAIGIYLLSGGRKRGATASPANQTNRAEDVSISKITYKETSRVRQTPAPAPSMTSQSAATTAPKAGEAQLPGERDIKNIVQIARDKSLDEAYASYQIYVNEILREQASNKDHLQTLLKATIDLSDFDPANDHYAFLVPLYNRFPTQVEEALYDLNLDLSVRADVLDTVKSFARAMAKSQSR